MDRRDFLMSSAAVALAGAATIPASAAAFADPLNPPGIKMAGIRMLPVRGGQYKVWTKTIGEGPVKVLLLHGGPAATHDYLEAFESFLPPAGIQMIYYDQLGCGNSDIPDDASLWTLPGFVGELEDVRQGLGLDQFVLLGHSWGGMLGIEYALQYQRHLRGLVISNMVAGIKAYLKRTAALKDWLSPADRKRLAELDASQDYDNPDYHRIVEGTLYPQMICRTVPWPEPVTRSIKKFNLKIYEQMQGKSEFLVTGNLKDWERWDRLHEIRTRALMIGSRYDEMDPADMMRMATLMPNAQGFVCPNGSHMAMWDDQAYYFDHLLAWLKTI